MKRVAIIGGGIVGVTTAFYLSRGQDFEITIYDNPRGQSTSAAAGIIAPWLSKRRNQQWYRLAREGAALYQDLAQTAQLSTQAYSMVGTFITRSTDSAVEELWQLANSRIQAAPSMKHLEKWSRGDVVNRVPLLNEHYSAGVFVEGGARVDGHELLTELLAQTNAKLINKTAQLSTNLAHELMVNETMYDSVVVAAGARTSEVVDPLGFHLLVKPQKGQLIELASPKLDAEATMPVIMPEGQAEIIPDGHQHLLVGATHEKQGGFDLTPTQPEINSLVESASAVLSNLPVSELAQMITHVRVGTRPYTDDFTPFMGRLPNNEHVWVASGLGSSGLTTGPKVGQLLAQDIIDNTGFEAYSHPITNYLLPME